MRVLAIETATAYGGVALLGADPRPIRRSFPLGLTHGRHILIEVDRAVAEAGLRPKEIELIAVDRGPGSYTGIRVGVTAAKCLARALGIPVVGVDALRVLAEGVPHGYGWVAPIVDAHRREVYGALFDRSDPSREGFGALVGSPGEVADRLPPDAVVFGDGVERYPEVFARFRKGFAEWTVPDPVLVGALAVQALHARGPDDPVSLVPVYLRPSEAEIKLRERRWKEGVRREP